MGLTITPAILPRLIAIACCKTSLNLNLDDLHLWSLIVLNNLLFHHFSYFSVFIINCAINKKSRNYFLLSLAISPSLFLFFLSIYLLYISAILRKTAI